MADGLWRAWCSCGWHSGSSPDLAEQTDELDTHLRVVVIAEQRPTRVNRAATAAVVQAVDHTLAAAGLVLATLAAAPLLARSGRTA